VAAVQHDEQRDVRLVSAPVGTEARSFKFWFMMQIAKIAGFSTSYPVNWWLIETGGKERM
jgi:hypothetical protein